MNPQDYLFQWTQVYIKNKDAIRKSIVSVDLKQPFVNVKYNDKAGVYEAAASLKNAKFQPSSIIVTFNTLENFKALLELWKELVARQITLIFINPNAAPDNKWFVAAHVHNAISDRASLKQGLKSLFEGVPALSSEDMLKLADAGEF